LQKGEISTDSVTVARCSLGLESTEPLRDKWSELSDDTLFALGDAITETAPKGAIDTLLEIAAEPKFGHARTSPMLNVARFRDPRVGSVIASYLKENDNPWLAIRALRLARMRGQAGWVRPYLSSSNEYHRTEARQFFRALEKPTGG
jgi:hypothetical protein